MSYYYEKIEHKNVSDSKETVMEITSTEEEKKHIDSIIITKEANVGNIEGYIEREKILSYQSGKANIQNFIEIVIDRDLKVGDKFQLKMQNAVAGTNAEIYGLVKYQIK